MANIFLSVPIIDGKPELQMIYTMYQAIMSCKEHKVRVYFNSNDSLISRIRNCHISVFLHDFPECDYYMSLDSDLELINVFPSNNIFTKLVAHNLDFVGGLYTVKKPGVIRSSSISMDPSQSLEFDSGLKEMRWLSSGCWCVKRSVVEKMVNAYPELDYEGDDNMVGKKIHGLFIPYIYKMTKEEFPGSIKDDKPFRKYLSEDWAMCQRWRDIGGEIFADTSIVLRHIGKHSYNLFDVEVVQKTGTPPVATSPASSPVAPPPGFDLK